MRRTIITVIVCLAFSAFGFQTSIFAENVIPCIDEPTDQTIQYGDFLECEISSVGDKDIFRFEGSIDEKIIVQATDQSGGPFEAACVTLFGPDGMPTPNGGTICNGLTARIHETLIEDGEHTIVVEEGSGRTMPYGLALERVAPPSPGSTPICFGCGINESIDGIGDIDLYIFDGSVGDIIEVSATDQSGGPFEAACVTLFGPDGMPTPNGGRICDGLTAQINETLQVDGVHAFLVEEGSGRTMPYSTNLVCISGPCRDEKFSLDLKVNGRAGKVIVTPTQNVSVTLSLSRGEVEPLPVEWWVGALTTSFGNYWFNSAGQWTKTMTPYKQGPLEDLPETDILNLMLPLGVYKFFVLIETNIDGEFNPVKNQTAEDDVRVYSKQSP
jgi:hypothetical protein